jgi:serine/threonine-protein kinase
MAALELDATQAVGEASSERDEDALASGERVGEYVVDCRLGAGAFGAVYRARHPVLGRDVAIKILHRSVSSNEEIVGRFLAEARAVNQIRHRNIIDIFGFGQLADGRHFYVMECLAGEPLDATLARKGAFAPGEALPLLRAIAKALDAAHEQGIVHRDLKAENVFLAREGEDTYPKLLDFGIAKLISSEQGGQSRTRSGIQVGTPYAMAPEQCRGVAVDGRADVYALGVLTHRMLTGAYLFDGETAMDVIMKHMAAKPPPMSSVARSVPAALDKPVLRMLAKDPSDRFARPTEAIDALGEAMARAGVGDGLGVRSSGMRATLGGVDSNTLRSAMFAGVRGTRSAVVPAVALLALAAAGASWWGARRATAVDAAGAAAPGREVAPSSVTPPVVAPSREAATLELRIAVRPSSARVFVDDQEVGVGAATITRASGERVRVRAAADGHAERSETFVLESATRLEWILEPLVPAPREAAKPSNGSASPKPKRRDRAVHSDLANPLD